MYLVSQSLIGKQQWKIVQPTHSLWHKEGKWEMRGWIITGLLLFFFLVLVWRHTRVIAVKMTHKLSNEKLHTKGRPAAAAAAKSLQSCPTLCDPIDGNPPGSPVPGILQVKTVEWVAISFSNAWKWKVKVKSLSRARLLATPWTAAYQAPPSMGFSRQEYWSGLPLPSPLIC